MGAMAIGYTVLRERTDRTSSVNLNASKKGNKSNSASSLGSSIQVSIGIPFSNKVNTITIRHRSFSLYAHACPIIVF